MKVFYLFMKHKNLVIIGTSHIAKQSLEEVEKTIKEFKPDIVAIELDRKRYYALLNGEKRGFRFNDIRRIGIKGAIFSLIGAWAEKKLGQYVGVAPGSEMLKAIELAKKNKIQIRLIDQDIEVTLKKFSKAFSWKEKWHFVVDIVMGLLFGKSEMKKLGMDKFDLTKVPSKKIIKKLIMKVKERYPNVYKVLIEERNYYMAAQLKRIISYNPKKKIVVVIGAGHEDDVLSLVKGEVVNYKYDIIY
jgi:pheromone shutdown-related protein TraB